MVESHRHIKARGFSNGSVGNFSDPNKWLASDVSLASTDLFTDYYGEVETKPASISVNTVISYWSFRTRKNLIADDS